MNDKATPASAAPWRGPQSCWRGRRRFEDLMAKTEKDAEADKLRSFRDTAGNGSSPWSCSPQG